MQSLFTTTVSKATPVGVSAASASSSAKAQFAPVARMPMQHAGAPKSSVKTEAIWGRTTGVTMNQSAEVDALDYGIRGKNGAAGPMKKLGGGSSTFMSGENRFESLQQEKARPFVPRASASNISMSAAENSSKTEMFGFGGLTGGMFTAASAPRSSVAMNAASQTGADAPTVTGAQSVTPKKDYQDMIFLSQTYDHYRDMPHYAGNQFKEELMKNAKYLSTPGKGILASDESNGTCGKRFEGIGLENTEENRRRYREMLYTTPGLGDYTVGAIMYDETARQSTKDGKRFCEVLKDNGILPGIKVDTGVMLIQGTKDESATMGLDGLGKRCAEYYEMGCRFAKWRAVLKIDDGCPSEQAIMETAHSLARYATICQHNGLVPIVEPEILSDGVHDIKKCAEVTEKVLTVVMSQLNKQHVLLEGMLLKPNMILEGAQSGKEASPQEVGFYTVRTLSRTIPPAVPGITFLSGGQSEERACQNLNAINQLAVVKHPWSMSFSYGRALQSSVLKTWAGKDENIEAAQARLVERSKACSESSLGKYEGGAGQTSSDYQANYVY